MTGHRPVATPLLQNAKDALECLLPLIDISASIWDGNAIVYLAGCSFVFLPSGLRRIDPVNHGYDGPPPRSMPATSGS
jgi:hypothetical protein